MKKLFLSFLLLTTIITIPFTVKAATVYSDNLLSGMSYTHNGSNWYKDYSTDTNSTFLTDGILGGRYYNPDFYGVKGNESPDIRFEFDSSITFKEIHINFVQSGEAGITLPELIVYRKTAESDYWETLYSGVVTDDDFTLKSETDLTATELRLHFISTGAFVFIKEIMAYDYDTPATLDKTLEIIKKDDVISKGKPYYNTRYVHPDYPDTDNAELTDGVYAEFSDVDEWTGTIKGETDSGFVYDDWPLYTTVIDLEKPCAVSDVEVNFLRDGAKEINLPLAVRIYASEDNENWMKLGYLSNIADYNAGNFVYTYGLKTKSINGVMTSLAEGPVKARYIRVDFEKRGTNLLDEITVFGSTDTTDAVTLTNLSKLENGEVMRVSEKTGFVRDMALCYQYLQPWTAKRFKPIITYVDKNNNSVDAMYDTVLFLAQRNAAGVRVYDIQNYDARISDWFEYLEQTFGENGDVATLNEAARQASLDLNDPDFKTNYVVMIPFPTNYITDFGELNGKNLDLTTTDDTKYLLDWYIDTVCEYVENSSYDYLDFKGFYWMNEYPSRTDMIAYANDLVRETGYKSYWIPYFNSVGYFWNEDLRFDALTLQPNHFFHSSKENTLGAGGTTIIGTVAKLGAYGGFGVEMEMDVALMSDVDAYNRGLDYLNGAVQYNFDGPEYFRNWYLGGDLINSIATSRLPDSRKFYEYIYELMNGSYEIKPYLTRMNDNLLLGLPYTHNVSAENWYAERTTDTGCTFLTDGLAGGNFYHKDYLGVKNQDVTITMDFEDKKSIKEIHLDLLEDISASLFLPQNVDIYSKSGDTYELVYSGEVPTVHTVLRFNRAFASEGLEFRFTRTRVYLFIKELMAFDKDTDTAVDVNVTLPALKGDVNADGIFDNDDIALLKRYFAGYDVNIDKTASDINGDNKVTRADLVAIFKLERTTR